MSSLGVSILYFLTHTIQRFQGGFLIKENLILLLYCYYFLSSQASWACAARTPASFRCKFVPLRKDTSRKRILSFTKRHHFLCCAQHVYYLNKIYKNKQALIEMMMISTFVIAKVVVAPFGFTATGFSGPTSFLLLSSCSSQNGASKRLFKHFQCVITCIVLLLDRQLYILQNRYQASLTRYCSWACRDQFL